jgi:hypothetical protein
MTPLGHYYIRPAGGGGGRGSDSGIGPIYSVPPFIQRGHGIGSFLRGLWRTVRHLLWSSAKSLGRKALRTGGKIMTEIADNPSHTGHILSQHATETTQYIIKTLRGGSRKRAASHKHHKAKRAKITKPKSSSSPKIARPRDYKGDIFS